MSVIVRTRLPLTILVICGVIMIADYFLQLPAELHNTTTILKNTALMIAAFALGLGVISLLQYHIRPIIRREEGWFYSAWTIIMMLTFLIVGGIYGTSSDVYQWLFRNVYSQVSMSLYALLGFYIVYACYRTFLIRSWEVLVMLVVAIFSMMGNAPISEWLWLGFSKIYSWIDTVLAIGGISAFYITVAIGVVVLALRIFIGKERASIG